MRLMLVGVQVAVEGEGWMVRAIDKYRLLHRKCDVRIFIHELQDFGKRTSERSERVSFPKS